MDIKELTLAQLTTLVNSVSMLQASVQHVGEHICPPLLEAIEAEIDRDYAKNLSDKDADTYFGIKLMMHPELKEAHKVVSHMTDLMEAIDSWESILKLEFDSRVNTNPDPFALEDAWNQTNADPIITAMCGIFGYKIMDKAAFMEKFYGE